MAAFSLKDCCVEDCSGALIWSGVLSLTGRVVKTGVLSDDVKLAIKARLKSDSDYVTLNTLTVLHTLAVNGCLVLREQLAVARWNKALHAMLQRPPFPGAEAAAAQLLLDWAFLFPREELGAGAARALAPARLRPLLAALAPSDVAVLLQEERSIGLPRYGLARGLDFRAARFTELATAPLTSSPSPVLAAYARHVRRRAGDAPLAASSSSGALPQPPADLGQSSSKAPTPEELLRSAASIHGAVGRLATAQRACHSSARRQLAFEVLSAQLHAGYAAACVCCNWRERIRHASEACASEEQLSALLELSDQISAVLDAWQAFASGEVFRMIGAAGQAGNGLHPSGLVAAAPVAPAACEGGRGGGQYADLMSLGEPAQQQRQGQAAAPAGAPAGSAVGGSIASSNGSSQGSANPFQAAALAPAPRQQQAAQPVRLPKQPQQPPTAADGGSANPFLAAGANGSQPNPFLAPGATGSTSSGSGAASITAAAALNSSSSSTATIDRGGTGRSDGSSAGAGAGHAGGGHAGGGVVSGGPGLDAGNPFAQPASSSSGSSGITGGGSGVRGAMAAQAAAGAPASTPGAATPTLLHPAAAPAGAGVTLPRLASPQPLPPQPPPAPVPGIGVRSAAGPGALPDTIHTTPYDVFADEAASGPPSSAADEAARQMGTGSRLGSTPASAPQAAWDAGGTGAPAASAAAALTDRGVRGTAAGGSTDAGRGSPSPAGTAHVAAKRPPPPAPAPEAAPAASAAAPSGPPAAHLPRAVAPPGPAPAAAAAGAWSQHLPPVEELQRCITILLRQQQQRQGSPTRQQQRTGACSVCPMPAAAGLAPALADWSLSLLQQQAQRHAAEMAELRDQQQQLLQQLGARHQAEVADIKAMAVRRIKEVLGGAGGAT